MTRFTKSGTQIVQSREQKVRHSAVAGCLLQHNNIIQIVTDTSFINNTMIITHISLMVKFQQRKVSTPPTCMSLPKYWILHLILLVYG